MNHSIPYIIIKNSKRAFEKKNWKAGPSYNTDTLHKIGRSFERISVLEKFHFAIDLANSYRIFTENLYP